MKTELIDVTECKKNLDIEIPHEIVDEEMTHIAREVARKARVPGFRPGKAPLGVVKTRYKDEIVSEMMQHLLPRYFTEAANSRNLNPVEAPNYEEIDYSNGKPLRFKAVFEVYPRLNITNYIGIPAEEISPTVEESEVESALKKLQEDMAELAPVEEERASRTGDFVEISFSGTVPGSEQVPVAADKAVCEIGGRTTLKEFSENLLGLLPGEERAFAVTYGPNHPDPKLAGKTVEYNVRIDGLKEKRVPELNAEFAEGLGDYKTLDELKANVRSNIGRQKSEHAREQFRDKLLEWLEDNNEFEIPESLVERQLQIRVQRLLRDIERQGINPQRLDVDWERVREDQHRQAVRDVKGSLILDHIAEKEHITVDDTEADAEIERIAAETDRPPERVKEILTRDSGRERLKLQLRHRKVLDFLQERAALQPPRKTD